MNNLEIDFILMIVAFLLFIVTIISIAINFPIFSLILSLIYFVYVYLYFKNKKEVD